MRIVIKKKPYRGHAVGREIEVTDRLGRVLIAVGLASKPAPKAPERIVPAKATAKVEQVESAERPKRAYRRRDMKAES